MYTGGWLWDSHKGAFACTRHYTTYSLILQGLCDENALKLSAGKDATNAFSEAAHSDFAKEMLLKFYVGNYLKVLIHKTFNNNM